MSNGPGWKDALKESNAVGWIAFFLLVVGFGVGTLLLDRPPDRTKGTSPIAQADSGSNTR